MRRLLVFVFTLLLYSTVLGGLQPCSNYSIVCHDKGSCIKNECLCHDGWAGTYCEDVDYCQSQPCVHGTCSMWNYKCYCEEGYNGPNCEYESNPKAVRKSYAQDNFETIIDLQPIASSTHMKINSLLNVAQFFNRTFNIDFKIYVDSEGPMIYDWVSGKRQRLNVELTKDAFAYTKEYKLDDYHKTNYVFTTSYDFVQDYNATEFPWYFGHSSKNPNWHKRISVFVYYAQDCSSWKKTNDQPECPMDYLVAIDKSRQMAKDDYHKRTIFFGIKINDSKNRICEVQSTNGFWFVIWIVSMIGFLGLIVLLVSPRYSTTLQNHLNSIFGKNNDGVEMNEMLLGQH